MIQAYDVWKEKKNYGKVSKGVLRTTYLIDENGIIIKAFDKVKAANNPFECWRHWPEGIIILKRNHYS